MTSKQNKKAAPERDATMKWDEKDPRASGSLFHPNFYFLDGHLFAGVGRVLEDDVEGPLQDADGKPIITRAKAQRTMRVVDLGPVHEMNIPPEE